VAEQAQSGKGVKPGAVVLPAAGKASATAGSDVIPAAAERFRKAAPTLAKLAGYPATDEGVRRFLADQGINVELLLALEKGDDEAVQALVAAR
jgi:hypothetical protein